MLGAILSGVLRSVGRAASPMLATTATVLVNSVLGFALVTGAGPLPPLGVAGAGWATLVTAIAKVGILAVQAYGRGGVGVAPAGRPSRVAGVVVPLFVLALPLGVTELFWTSGTFLYNVVFQRLGYEALAAAQIVTTLEGDFIVGSIGLMRRPRRWSAGPSARETLPARHLGAPPDAGGVGTGLVFGLLFASSVPCSTRSSATPGRTCGRWRRPALRSTRCSRSSRFAT